MKTYTLWSYDVLGNEEDGFDVNDRCCLDREFVIPAVDPECLGDDDAHLRAAKALCEKMKWAGKLAMGHTKRGCVFVFVR